MSQSRLNGMLTSIGKKLVAAGAVAMLATAFAPALRAQEVLFRNGYSEMIYDPEAIFNVRMKVGYKTMILFPNDDEIVRVEVGIRGNVLEIKYGPNWIALRPSQENLATNLHVATRAGRVYSFDLKEVSVSKGSEPFHQKVVMLRPDMETDADGGPAVPPERPMPQRISVMPPAAAPSQSAPVRTSSGRMVSVDDLDTPGEAPARPVVVTGSKNNVPGADIVRRLDKGYVVRNQRPKLFAVDNVFNDGERTFVVFRSTLNEAPLFYRINADGKRELLQYTILTPADRHEKDVFVIPRLVDKGVVKVGDAESIFIWKKTL